MRNLVGRDGVVEKLIEMRCTEGLQAVHVTNHRHIVPYFAPFTLVSNLQDAHDEQS